ncbi:hypothetical protein HDV05_006118 [Chytridiales sp. JEL 0842]|nr:hypothetical protein HDV05_006118 [Chytridiales sp. JEL 0842]
MPPYSTSAGSTSIPPPFPHSSSTTSSSSSTTLYLNSLLQPTNPKPPSEILLSLLNWSEKCLLDSSIENQQTLFLCLPNICEWLFGSSEDSLETVKGNGILRRPLSERDRHAFLQLLSPSSAFFKLLLRLSRDQTMVYDIRISKLPLQTQQLLKSGNAQGLSALYTGRIQFDHASAASSALNSTYNAAGPAGASPATKGQQGFQQQQQQQQQQQLQQQPQQQLQRGNLKVTFNILEFFLFCFTHLATFSKPYKPPASAFSRQQPVYSTQSSSPSAFSQTGVDPVYLTLLNIYLKFFFPCPPPAQNNNSSPAPNTLDNNSNVGSPQSVLRGQSSTGRSSLLQTPTKGGFLDGLDGRYSASSSPFGTPSMFGEGLRRRGGGGEGEGSPWSRGVEQASAEGSAQVKKAAAGSVDILNTSELDFLLPSSYTTSDASNPRIAISTFVLQTFSELWLNQNTIPLPISTQSSTSNPYIPPTPAQILCVRFLIQHLMLLDPKSLYSVPTPPAFGSQHYRSPGTNSHNTLNAGASNKEHLQLTHLLSQTLQKSLFPFLYTSLQNENGNDNLTGVVDLWLYYTFPFNNSPSSKTKSGNVGVGDEWVPWVSGNYIYYATLLKVWMERAVKFDLFAAVRPSSKLPSSSSSTSLGTVFQSPSTTGAIQPPSVASGASPAKMQMGLLEGVLSFYNTTPGLLNVLRSLEDLIVALEPSMNTAPTSSFTVGGGASGLLGGSGYLAAGSASGGMLLNKTSSFSNLPMSDALKAQSTDTILHLLRSSLMQLQCVLGPTGGSSLMMFRGLRGDVGRELGLMLGQHVGVSLGRLGTYLPLDYPGSKGGKTLQGGMVTPKKKVEGRDDIFLETPKRVGMDEGGAMFGGSPKRNRKDKKGVTIEIGIEEGRLFNWPSWPKGAEANLGSYALFALVWICALLYGCLMWTLQFFLRLFVTHSISNSSSSGNAGSDGSGGSPKLRQAQLTSVKASLDRLQRLSEAVCNVLEVDAQEIQLALESQSSVNAFSQPSVDNSQQQQQDPAKEIAPGVLEPDWSAVGFGGAYLSPQGKLQVKRGWRKCDPADVPVRGTKRVERIVKSYEIEWMVKGSLWVADLFDEKYTQLKQAYPFLPPENTVGLHWLRLFAAWPNLRALFVLIVVCWFLRWFLGIMLGGSSTSAQYHQQQRQRQYEQYMQYQRSQQGGRRPGNVGY